MTQYQYKYGATKDTLDSRRIASDFGVKNQDAQRALYVTQTPDMITIGKELVRAKVLSKEDVMCVLLKQI